MSGVQPTAGTSRVLIFDEQMRSSHVQVIPYLQEPTGGRVMIIGGEQDLPRAPRHSGELQGWDGGVANPTSPARG